MANDTERRKAYMATLMALCRDLENVQGQIVGLMATADENKDVAIGSATRNAAFRVSGALDALEFERDLLGKYHEDEE